MVLKLNKYSRISIFLLGSCLLSCKQESQQSPSASEIEIVQKSEKVQSTRGKDQLPYFTTADFTPHWSASVDDLKAYHKIPDFQFTNQLGEEISASNLKGKIYVANFFFTTCPNICLKLTKSMHDLQEAYADDDSIRLLSHTVMPSVDTVEVLKEYGELQDINPKKWYLLTGEKEKIYELAREAYFADDLYKQTKDKNRFVHTENLMLIDKNSHIRGVYNGTIPTEVPRIIRHIAMLKKE